MAETQKFLFAGFTIERTASSGHAEWAEIELYNRVTKETRIIRVESDPNVRRA